jgi:hypothetical protein
MEHIAAQQFENWTANQINNKLMIGGENIAQKMRMAHIL